MNSVGSLGTSWTTVRESRQLSSRQEGSVDSNGTGTCTCCRHTGRNEHCATSNVKPDLPSQHQILGNVEAEVLLYVSLRWSPC